MTRIVVAASAVYGHFAPMRSIAADLVGRGHQVTVLTGSVYRDEVRATGAAFAAVDGTADFVFAEKAADPERLALPVGPAQLDWDVRNIFLQSVPGQHSALQRVLADTPDEPVVLLAETGFAGALPVMLGAPGHRPAAVVGIGVLPLTISSVDTAPFGMGLPPDYSKEGRARNRELNAAMQNQVLGDAQRLFAGVLADLGCPDRPPFFMDAPLSEADVFLQLSVEELSYRRTDLPEHVHFIGRLPADPGTGTRLPHWWADVLDSERVVVVTQGTLANLDLGKLIEPALEALADERVLVVAATGTDREVRGVPANARVTPFIPFELLLPHTDLLITNGGFGGVQQALAHGVPMVLAGQSEDKLESNVRVAATGAAVNLGTDTPSPVDIRKAVDTVLSEPGYRQNAARLQADYAVSDALDVIDTTIRRLVSRRA